MPHNFGVSQHARVGPHRAKADPQGLDLLAIALTGRQDHFVTAGAQTERDRQIGVQIAHGAHGGYDDPKHAHRLLSPASNRQAHRHDAMLQGSEPIPHEQTQKATAEEKRQQPQGNSPGPTVRAEKGLGLLPLMLLYGDDLGHSLLGDALGRRVDGGWIVAFDQDWTQVIRGHQGITKSQVDALSADGRHRVGRISQ
jgi:hypothetical protein